jgi:uncharacterized protein (DUF433 family)
MSGNLAQANNDYCDDSEDDSRSNRRFWHQWTPVTHKRRRPSASSVIKGEFVRLHQSYIHRREDAFRQRIRCVTRECCSQHPMISCDRGIFGGIPHIREMRLSVGDVLAQIYTLESIDAVVDYYDQEISKEQVKEAIAYAQDFLETACDPYQADD